MQAGTVHHKLAQAGIHQTFQPVTHQRAPRPFSGEALLIDGQLFSALPAATSETCRHHLEDQRSGKGDSTRPSSTCGRAGAWPATPPPMATAPPGWRCPFRSGFLCAQFPRTMRRPKTVPFVPVDEGCKRCCRGILTAQAAEMAWWQRITYGTTAWRISMGRPKWSSR